MATPPTTADDADFDIVGMTDEVTSLDDDNAVNLFLMTKTCTRSSKTRATRPTNRPAWLHSEEDVAEAIFFLETLGIAPGKIHPARALQRAEAEYSLGTLDNERTSELAKSFGCQRVNKSTTAVIKAVIGMHVTSSRRPSTSPTGPRT